MHGFHTYEIYKNNNKVWKQIWNSFAIRDLQILILLDPLAVLESWRNDVEYLQQDWLEHFLEDQWG